MVNIYVIHWLADLTNYTGGGFHKRLGSVRLGNKLQLTNIFIH